MAGLHQMAHHRDLGLAHAAALRLELDEPHRRKTATLGENDYSERFARSAHRLRYDTVITGEG